jgi:hypothetical protein
MTWEASYTRKHAAALKPVTSISVQLRPPPAGFSRAQPAIDLLQDHGTAQVQSREPQVSITNPLVWCTVSKLPLGSSALCMVGCIV